MKLEQNVAHHKSHSHFYDYIESFGTNQDTHS